MKPATEKIILNIEGMDCTNCALSITKTLEKRGMQDVYVNFATGEASFRINDKKLIPKITEDINGLGYKVVEENHTGHAHAPFDRMKKKFYFCLTFTLPLFFHMFLPFAFLHNAVVQLILCLPVLIVGILQFGKSAWRSIRIGLPNMDVLIFIGSSAAFIYSLIGTILFYGTTQIHDYLFYETAATIITLVLLGNLLEQMSVKQTTTAIKDLQQMQKIKSLRVEMKEGKEYLVEVDHTEIKVGDVLQINTGDKIPIDGEIISGDVSVDESIITGESLPVEKKSGDKVIGGTLAMHGNIRMLATRVGKETALSKIIELVKNAQLTKPDIQKIGDKVSGVFVPAVLAASLSTFLLAHWIFDITLQKALMNAIAVLVISCPCAMGLATPTAVMVGIGRAAKNGILIKGGSTLEEFAKIKNVVFDKTGTLTTGNFKIKKIHCVDGNTTEQEIKNILFSLEHFSSHPLARSIVQELKGKAEKIKYANVTEEKGSGVFAKDEQGNSITIGSYKTAKQYSTDDAHQLYVVKNNKLLAFVDMEDEIKPTAKKIISNLKQLGITTVLLSGDQHKKCADVAAQLGIDIIFSERSPSQKLEEIDNLIKQAPTAMVGDGINDSPALAKATVGISLSNATQIAIQTAQVVLLNSNDLMKLEEAFRISKHTLLTIKQNLFWAFFYNVVAIPVAAMGFLNPMVGALAMAFSDVVIIGNSIRLKSKKI